MSGRTEAALPRGPSATGLCSSRGGLRRDLESHSDDYESERDTPFAAISRPAHPLQIQGRSRTAPRASPRPRRDIAPSLTAPRYRGLRIPAAPGQKPHRPTGQPKAAS